MTVRRSRMAWKPSFHELWKARDMLFFMVLRDFKIRFKQSFLGFTWVLLQPLLSTLVFSAVIGKALNVSFDAPYPLAFLSALMGWNYFTKVMGSGINTVVAEAEMIKKVYFPRLILPLYQGISYLVDLAIALLIYLALAFYYDWSLGLELLALPFFVLLTLSLGMGLSLWLAPLNVRFRDIQIIVPLFLQVFFILTPVMYPVPLELKTAAGGWLSFFYQLNPMVGIVEGYRYCLLGAGDPWTAPNLCSYAFVAALLCSGLVFFNHSQEKFADVI